MRKILTVFCVMLSVMLSAQSFKQLKIQDTSPSTVKMLLRAGIDLEGAVRHKDGTADIIVSPAGYKKLLDVPIRFSVIINDLTEFYKSQPQLSADAKQAVIDDSKAKYNVGGFGFGSMGGYYTYAEISANLDSMYSRFPGLITRRFSIGSSTEGRQLWAVKISDNPNVDEDEPQTFFDGLIHAREPQSMATLMYFMWYLLENYGSDPEVTYLVNEREIYFVPCFNPDGYEYNRVTNPDGGGMFRGNRRYNGNGTFGVDLNRNFGYKWGFDDIGSSPYPGDETYRGPWSFSEPEPQHIRDFLNSKHVKSYINYHSYNNSIIYPWGYTDRLTADSLTYFDYARYMSRYNGYDYGNSWQTLGYVSNGTARDWGYGEQVSKGKIFSYTFEVGSGADGFWPQQSRIFPLAQQNIRPNLFQAWIAGPYIQYRSASFNQEYFLPDDTASMFITLKNNGLNAGADFTVDVSSASPGLFIISGQSTTSSDSIAPGAIFTLSEPVRFLVLPGTSASVKLKMQVKVSIDGLPLSTDTVSIIVGKPVYLLRDSCNSITPIWTVTAYPSWVPRWETTSTTSHSLPSCFTDSKAGTYTNSSTVSLTTLNPINLTNYPHARLRFSTKFDIEKKWDCGVVLISTNGGTSWTPLAGQYSIPASGSGTQIPAGMPCYDSQQPDWLNEEIDLSPYANQMIRLRFDLRTDASENYDGWYLDDIAVIVYVIPQSAALTWSSQLSVSCPGGTMAELTFGTSAYATDGLDPELGEQSLPPIPPPTNFDCRFQLPVSPPLFSSKDLRNDSLWAIDWRIKLQAGSSGYPLTIHWTPASLPQGNFILSDAINGNIVNINMKTHESYTLTNPDITELKIRFSRQACKTLVTASGWNIVSVPLNAPSMNAAVLFPQANSAAYGFANGYITADILATGNGYWLRFPNSSEINVCGTVPSGSLVSLNSGWNLIGAYMNDVSVSAITSNPPNIINSAFFGYDNGYFPASTLQSGKGYWVRANQQGTLSLPAFNAHNTMAKNSDARRLPDSYINIADASGHQGRLYIFDGEEIPVSPVGSTIFSAFGLPPLPPVDIFDIRYTSDSFAENLSSPKIICINNAVWPIIITPHGASIEASDAASGGRLFNLTIADGSDCVLNTPEAAQLIVRRAGLPKQFSLSQNYPNPFNPETEIIYNIGAGTSGRQKILVTLKVYDLLGREITTITEEELAPGQYRVKFNAAGLASGIYCYEITAGSFRAVKKMAYTK